jgi:DNA gyrase subunit B
MYFGSIGPSGLRALLMEIVSNSVDQVLAGRADAIDVTIHSDRSVTVFDTGPGFGADGQDPIAAVRSVLTNFHTTPTADGHRPHVHLSFGVGLGPVSAVCERIEIEVVSAGTVSTVTFARGEFQSSCQRPADGERAGTTVRFQPDPEIFAPLRWSHSQVHDELVSLTQLIPGLTVRFTAAPQTYGPTENLISLFEEVRGWTELIHDGPILVSADDGENRVRLAIGWHDANWGPTVRSYCNLRSTGQGGSHVKGIEEGLRLVFSPGPVDDLMKGLVAVLHVLLLEPKFAGPTRSQLDSPEAVWLVAGAIEAQLPSALDASAALREHLRNRTHNRPTDGAPKAGIDRTR